MSNNERKAGFHRVRRLAERGAYDRATIDAILDAALHAHVALVDDGRPVVIPMVTWRVGDFVHVHSANRGRFASVCAGAEISLCVTHLDAVILARSAYNHSMNYRSVVVHGCAEVVDDVDQKQELLRALIEKVCPGRWDQLRPVTVAELAGTVVLRLPLEHAAAKVRTGMPGDEKDDPGWPVWTGILPVENRYLAPVADPTMPDGIAVPAALLRKADG